MQIINLNPITSPHDRSCYRIEHSSLLHDREPARGNLLFLYFIVHFKCILTIFMPIILILISYKTMLGYINRIRESTLQISFNHNLITEFNQS